MYINVMAFSDEQSRVLINIEQHYRAWIEAEREGEALAYGMRWKSSGNRDYLYEIIDRKGNGKSLGPRSAKTETLLASYQSRKADIDARLQGAGQRLRQTCAIYRSLRLPLLATDAAKILREADRRSMLDGNLLVVGTNAMPAYAIEAGGFILDAPSETDDFDMAWAAEEAQPTGTPVWTMLKSVDPTFTVNMERTFQARNADAYEVELLVAPSRADTLRRGDKPLPVPLEEQEWLLLGRPVDHVVVARDGSPARIVAPDPRWFALQKLWMSEQEKRNPLKRPKDAKQGTALLNVVRETMPQYPLDATFEAEIPEDLQPYYRRWLATAPPLPSIAW